MDIKKIDEFIKLVTSSTEKEQKEMLYLIMALKMTKYFFVITKKVINCSVCCSSNCRRALTI